MCSVCLDREVGMINLICGHVSICEKCVEIMENTCPVCREEGPFIKIFYPSWSEYKPLLLSFNLSSNDFLNSHSYFGQKEFLIAGDWQMRSYQHWSIDMKYKKGIDFLSLINIYQWMTNQDVNSWSLLDKWVVESPLLSRHSYVRLALVIYLLKSKFKSGEESQIPPTNVRYIQFIIITKFSPITNNYTLWIHLALILMMQAAWSWRRSTKKLLIRGCKKINTILSEWLICSQ